MPRPKRQRPAWLPTWVPFKDGRLLGLAKQTILAWISAALALCFFLLTVSYATEKSRFSRLKFVHASRSNTILVLRILSEAAGVLLGSTIYSTFELVQWVLISRPDGVRLPQYLALQSGTGPLGLLVLALGKGLPARQWPMKPRIMSLLRLIAELVVPVAGVLIMSNVNTNAVYVPIRDTIQPFALGMEPFNGSVASELGVMQDLLFNINYVTFLFSPSHSINMELETEHHENCVKGLGITTKDSCHRHVLIAQEYQNVEANLPLQQHPETSVVLSMNQQVYSLEYLDNIEVRNHDLVCETFGSGPSQYRFCIRNADNGGLEASMVPCPADLVVQNGCAKSGSWFSNEGFSTALKTSFLDATVSYDRQDGRILSHEVQTEAKSANVDAPDLLNALKAILNTTAPTLNSTSENPVLGMPSHFFGRLVAGHMYRIGMTMKANPATRIKGVNALQSILALTLFYCQNGILGQTVLPFAPANNATRVGYQTGAFSQQDKSAKIALAETRYRIEVGHATLLAYIVLSGVTLLICLLALIVGSIMELVNLDAEPTLWPALDFWTQCRVEDRNGKVISAHQRVEMAWIYDGRELFKGIEGLRVKRRKRKMRGNEELELPNAEES